ncbi:MAG: hypothetical protein OHK0046_25880 [Anaerolineae bacterium]
MEASDVKRLQDLETENRRLKQMCAELSLDHQILKEILEKKLSRWQSERAWWKSCRANTTSASVVPVVWSD